MRLITFNDLLRRGWSPNMVFALLPQPDKQINRSTWYDLVRVEAAERSQEFSLLAHVAKFKKQSVGTKKERERNRKLKNKTMHLAKHRGKMKLKQVMPLSEVEPLALKWHHENYVDEAVPSVEQLCVNYLRHDMSLYDQKAEEFKHRPGAGAARAFLFCRTILRIMQHYPTLRQECFKQIHRRTYFRFYAELIRKNCQWDVAKITSTVVCPWDDPEWMEEQYD